MARGIVSVHVRRTSPSPAPVTFGWMVCTPPGVARLPAVKALVSADVEVSTADAIAGMPRSAPPSAAARATRLSRLTSAPAERAVGSADGTHRAAHRQRLVLRLHGVRGQDDLRRGALRAVARGERQRDGG